MTNAMQFSRHFVRSASDLFRYALVSVERGRFRRAVAMMLQRFDFVLDDPSYQLKVHEPLTLKPENLKIRARARRSLASLARGPSAARQPQVLTQPAVEDRLPPMKARQYSISSSPLWKPDNVTLTIAVVDAPALSGHGRYQGVASSYLASLEPGDRVSIAVRPSNARFHPPADPKTPMIMICADSGIAPFRGFLQDRAAQKTGGQEIGPSLLFFGTNHPDIDYLYHDELSAWERDRVVEVLPAFSHRPDSDVKFVQDRAWAERERIAQLFQNGATVFICGDGRRIAPAVRETLIRIYRETSGVTESEADQWADEIEREHGRYAADVFA